MNELTTRNDLAELTVEQLRAELSRGLTLTATTLTRLGAVWAELERRGENLSDLRIGLARTLPLIASGRLAAEAVVAFAGRPMVLRSLEGVPLDEQRRLADGQPIPIYLPGASSPESLPLARIPSAAVSRVIVDGTIRTPAEQRLALRQRKAAKPQRHYAVSVDRDNRTLKVGNMTVPLASVIAAMAEAAGAKSVILDDAERPAKTIAGKVTDEEKERLKAAAKAHDLEEWELVRRAVVAMWLL